MSEVFEATRAGFRRVRAALNEADEDTRYKFAFWLIGLAMMAVGIVAQFGWAGVLFCGGAVIYAASDVRNTRS